jgi:hypothetical protein
VKKARKKKARHIRLNSTRERFECLRCGGTKKVKLPMRALDYAAAVDAFWQAHANCEEGVS